VPGDLDEVALQQVLQKSFFGSHYLIIIPPLFHTYLSQSHEVCGSRDHAANDNMLGL
jgi:hypothetical protein